MFFGIIVPKKLELYLFFGTIVSGSVGPQNGYGGMVGLQNLSRGTGDWQLILPENFGTHNDSSALPKWSKLWFGVQSTTDILNLEYQNVKS